jgi:hypothetical protein
MEPNAGLLDAWPRRILLYFEKIAMAAHIFASVPRNRA